MEKKSSNVMALFIALLIMALVAAFVTGLFVAVKYVYKGIAKKHAPVVAVSRPPQPAPVIPVAQPDNTQEFPPLPPEVEDEPAYTEVETPASEAPAAAEVCPATAMPVKIQKSRRKKKVTQFEKGLTQCTVGGIFPCAWEDNSRGLPRQYWVMSPTGPVQRGIYDRAGNLIHETIAEVSGTVTSYTERDITYYFDGGVLTKIRTSPYDNCNFHDWFYINAQGKQDVCQCAYNQPDCCARSPYKEGGPRTYCGLNPLDRDFCK